MRKHWLSRFCAGALLLFAVLYARAGEQQQRLHSFVENNLIGIFYHELGHALVDIANVPIYGQEEDAADVFSIFLINELYEEETARQLAMDASMGFLGEAELRESAGQEIAWWHVSPYAHTMRYQQEIDQ